MRRLLSIGAAVGVAAGAGLSGIGIAQSSYKRIAQKSAQGDFAIALASGNATRPRGIYVRVIATPRQLVSVTWNMVCSKGTGAGSKDGEYTTRSTKLRKLRMPTARPDSCTVAASGSLERGGKIKVQIFKR